MGEEKRVIIVEYSISPPIVFKDGSTQITLRTADKNFKNCIG
jgi:hypothetical protein